MLRLACYSPGLQLGAGSRGCSGAQGALAFTAALIPLRTCVFSWWEQPLESPAPLLLGTHHTRRLLENIPSGPLGSSVLDKLTTTGPKEDKFAGQGTDIMGGWGGGKRYN